MLDSDIPGCMLGSVLHGAHAAVRLHVQVPADRSPQKVRRQSLLRSLCQSDGAVEVTENLEIDMISVRELADAFVDRAAFLTRLGNCYRENALFVQLHSDTELVHGSIQGYDNPRISHAWCVNPDGTIHDAVLGQDWPLDAYERYFSAVADVTFSRDEVFTHLQNEKHWGPWEQ